jgi:hypothetical protein
MNGNKARIDRYEKPRITFPTFNYRRFYLSLWLKLNPVCLEPVSRSIAII